MLCDGLSIPDTNGAGALARAKAFSIRGAANDDGPVPVAHGMALSLLRRNSGELTSRQLGIFLTVYLDEGRHTVRGLATLFHICKPAVARSLDRLGELGLVRRNVDPRDRRSVLVHRTELGWAFLGELRRSVGRAADDAERSAEAAAAAAARRFAAGGVGHGGVSAPASPRRD
jgi:DNA-binding MarR family transcriptional regulator